MTLRAPPPPDEERRRKRSHDSATAAAKPWEVRCKKKRETKKGRSLLLLLSAVNCLHRPIPKCGKVTATHQLPGRPVECFPILNMPPPPSDAAVRTAFRQAAAAGALRCSNALPPIRELSPDMYRAGPAASAAEATNNRRCTPDPVFHSVIKKEPRRSLSHHQDGHVYIINKEDGSLSLSLFPYLTSGRTLWVHHARFSSERIVTQMSNSRDPPFLPANET